MTMYNVNKLVLYMYVVSIESNDFIHLPIFPHSRLIRTTRLLGTLEYSSSFAAAVIRKSLEPQAPLVLLLLESLVLDLRGRVAKVDSLQQMACHITSMTHHFMTYTWLGWVANKLLSFLLQQIENPLPS